MNLVEIDGKKLTIKGKLLRTARLEEEWFVDIEDPESFIKQIAKYRVSGDLFTFWQRLPETTPKYTYYMEWDDVAAIPIKSFEKK